jgi:pyruvate,water dikinase
VQGARYVLGRRGRLLRVDAPIATFGRLERHALAKLSRRATRLFGRPQDIEWAIATSGALRLLQSRPITTPAGRVRGPVYGPGPVAETFPDRLASLEEDLWVPPLDEGVRCALRAAGVRRRKRVVFALDGRVVADLDMLEPRRRSWRDLVDPRRAAHRLRASWRIGRLRGLLPDQACAVIDRVDSQLQAVPDLVVLTDAELLSVLERGKVALRSLHGHEVLCGLAMRSPLAAPRTAAGAGLAALAEARSRGLDDLMTIAVRPEVLALVAPRVGPGAPLPRVGHSPLPLPSTTPERASVDQTLAQRREDLRLRARWVQELMARAAHELAQRFASRGELDQAADVRFARLEDLRRAVLDGQPLAIAPPPGIRHSSVPIRFSLDASGRPVPRPHRGRPRGARDGQPAGGGRGVGPVVGSVADSAPGVVLVVRSLDPTLASALPGLAGLVAETGSVLSHLAILAREHGVATVVGVPDACRRWPPGTVVEVDGVAGTVIEVAGAARAPVDAGHTALVEMSVARRRPVAKQAEETPA